MKTLIRNGRIITAQDDYHADVLIEQESIAAIGRNLTVDAEAVFDASGLLVLPGGVDVHTHLDMPFGGTISSDDFETGTRAAAFGGTTTLIDFAMQTKGQSMRTALDTWFAKADGRAAIDYSFHMVVTDLPDAKIEEMNSLIRDGVTSFKLFMAYPGVLMVDDATIFKAMRAASRSGGLICMHAENGSVIDLIVREALAEGKTGPKYHALTRPTAAEAEAVGRAAALAEMADSPVYIVHLSSAAALEKVREARERGIPVYAETCPQYLFLSIEDYDRPGFEGAKYVFTPPLREKWNQDELWKGLANDHLQVISTDHCPFCFKEQKELGKNDFSKIPNGGPGIENRLSLVYNGGVKTGKITINRFVELVSTAPAKMFGLYPKKGTIAVGSDADLVLFDPKAETTISASTHHMRIDYSLYEGWRVTGSARKVFSRGKLIVDGDNFLGRAGSGSFIRRSTYTGL
jgi:dihydropyrimidinase